MEGEDNLTLIRTDEINLIIASPYHHPSHNHCIKSNMQKQNAGSFIDNWYYLEWFIIIIGRFCLLCFYCYFLEFTLTHCLVQKWLCCDKKTKWDWCQIMQKNSGPHIVEGLYAWVWFMVSECGDWCPLLFYGSCLCDMIYTVFSILSNKIDRWFLVQVALGKIGGNSYLVLLQIISIESGTIP